MNKHIDKAMGLRNEVPMINNCSQTIMRTYAKELGLDENVASNIACNFGGGMKCGSTCGVITAGLMILGAKGIDSPAVVGEFRRRIAENHNGMTDCAELLRENAKNGGIKKVHCDNMIKEAIELIDELVEREENK